MVSEKRKPWCVEPFTVLESKVFGPWGLCCRSGPLPYSARDVMPLDHFNSDLMKRVRLQMLNHQHSPEIEKYCFKCIEHEKNGVQSRRQGVNSTYEDMFPVVQQDGTINVEDMKFRQIEIKLFGNLCNLECRMCGPDYSSTIAARMKKEGTLDGPVLHDVIKNYNTNQLQSFYSDMEQILPHAIDIKFTGGEPMMLQSVHQFIEWMVDKGFNQHLRLKIISNGTKVNEKFLHNANKFRQFSIALSIDGTWDVDEYQRRGTNFEDVVNNIAIFKKYSDRVHIVGVLTALNVSDLNNLASFALHHNLKLNMSSVLVTPEELQVKVLPPQYRKKILKELQFNFNEEVYQALKDPEFPVDLWHKMLDKYDKVFEIIPELKQYDDRVRK